MNKVKLKQGKQTICYTLFTLHKLIHCLLYILSCIFPDDTYQGKKIKEKEIKRRNRLGQFHKLPKEMQHSLLQMALEYLPTQIDDDSKALEYQRDARRHKQELIAKKQLKQAEDEYIEKLYLYEKYASNTNAYWKKKN